MFIRRPYKILRTLLVTLLLLAVVVPAALWVLLSLSGFQEIVRARAEKELTTLLGTPVEIGRVNIAPFNSVTLSDVRICDDSGSEALNVERLGAGIELGRLLFTGDIVVSYVELVGMHVTLWRESADKPLNIQPIIDRLVKKEPGKPSTAFKLAVNIVVIRKSTVTYDVKDAPPAPDGRFSPRHIAVEQLRADVRLPLLSDSRNVIEVKRLAFTEQCGLTVESLTTALDITPDTLKISGLKIALPATQLAFADLDVALKPESGIKEMPLNVSLLDGSHVTPSDFAGFLPALDKIGNRIDLSFRVDGTPSHFDVPQLHLEMPSTGLDLSLEARVDGLPDGLENTTVTLPRFNLKFNAAAVGKLLENFLTPSTALGSLLSDAIGEVEVGGNAEIGSATALLSADLNCAAGNISLDSRINRRSRSLEAELLTQNLDLSKVLPSVPLTVETLSLQITDAAAGKPLPNGHMSLDAEGITFRNLAINTLSATADMSDGNIQANATANGRQGALSLDGEAFIGHGEKTLRAAIDLDRLDPAAFGIRLPGKLHSRLITTTINADLAGNNADDLTGSLNISDIALPTPDNENTLHTGAISLTASNDTTGRHINLRSDFINGNIAGNFRFAGLPHTVKAILAEINPEFFPGGTPALPDGDATADELAFQFSVEPDTPLMDFFNPPVRPLVPLTVSGGIDGATHMIDLVVNAPYLRQNDKLIEQTALSMSLDGLSRRSSMQFYTLFPAKNTQVGLTVTSDGAGGVHNTGIRWTNTSGRNHGDLRFTTAFLRDAPDGTENPDKPGPLRTIVSVNPGRIVFNDTVWHVHPSTIDIARGDIAVNDFRVTHAEQMLAIDGTASRDSSAVLRLTLRDINLDYVFETLNIPNVMFGGNATGEFYASSLLSGSPVLYTPELKVRNLAYNNCTMGDGIIRSAWHPDTKSITIDAVIDQEGGTQSFINGSINPFKELLDFRFDAHHANVGFLKPFMAAFCDNITGHASGRAHLFGTFKLLDMEGDLYGEDLRMTLGITGTTYAATDSVHIRPGRIELDDIVLTDVRGKQAILSGLLTHSSFKEPVFNFKVTGARDFLCYDMPPNSEHPWYGKIYGNGSVNINGRPGLVEIGVDMATAPGSEFTFVLSDEEVAADYKFLTFRDASPARPDTIGGATGLVPDIVRRLRDKVKQTSADKPTDYLMTFNVDVTPDASLVLVMDPVGGDRIRATGSGNLRMSYGSANDDLRMYGTYTLNRGFYNFTLQDIIIKDFTIENGSSITFHGDPYSAQLDIRAYYALNANLSDLDESFLQDRDLNRTNVPVHAMLLVNGDMRSPDISFDLEFPTLTQDTYRKVRSIVSTDDMMNRQIIYLLALNRFYTPEYVSATRGNELVSVASSTISSQLSSMLGQLSDKFSIAPSFRSDRGDFCDMEVDVALSSHLLNNRLLLNGTFGYRDKSLNDNSFIGDFDIEYLLNRSGSLRLKAYNRYNDQNYYLKSALTTQGVGIVYKRDFDNIFDFWHRMRRKWKNRQHADTIVITPAPAPPADSIPSRP